MIVAFPFAFNGKETEVEISLANLFIREIRKVDPPVTLIQLSDEATVELKGTDGCYRVDAEPLGIWFFKAMIQFPAEQFLRLDYDIIMREDVSEVFRHDFDIAIANEGKGVMNNGVVFVKDKEFFKLALDCYMTTEMDNWQDIQKAMQMAINTGKFVIHRLDPVIYNHYPERSSAPYPDSSKILHFKGSRKERMIREFA